VAFTPPSDTPNNGLWARFNRPVGRFVLVLSLVLLVLFIISYQVKPGNGGTTEPSNAGQRAPQPEQAQPQTVVAAEPSAQKEEETRHRRENEALQQQPWFLPDPPAPVALSKIAGIWWTEYDAAKDDKSSAEHKEFAFVEDSKMQTHYQAKLSLPNGTYMIVKCLEQVRPMEGTGNIIEDGFNGECVDLPLYGWIRIMAKDVVTNPASRQWGITYTVGGDTIKPVVLSNFLVTDICYPDDTCTTMEEAGKRAMEEVRDRARRGEN
jgi:hypothetical protein